MSLSPHLTYLPTTPEEVAAVVDMYKVSELQALHMLGKPAEHRALALSALSDLRSNAPSEEALEQHRYAKAKLKERTLDFATLKAKWHPSA